MEELSIIEIGSILLHKKWLIIIFTLFFGLAVFLVSAFMITPKYTATTSLYVNSGSESPSGTGTTINDITVAQKLVSTYIQILSSDMAITKVIDTLHLNYTVKEVQSMISMKAKNETEVLEIKVTTTSQEESILIANTLLETAPVILMRVVKAASVETVDTAVLAPQTAPNTWKNTAIGLLLGFILSVALSLVMAILDKNIRSAEDLSKRYNLPILSIVPNAYSYSMKGGQKNDVE